MHRYIIVCLFAFIFSQNDENLHVNIASDPPLANIYINHIYKGSTPGNIEGIKPGTYLLELYKKSYNFYSDSITVDKDSTNILFFDLQHTRRFEKEFQDSLIINHMKEHDKQIYDYPEDIDDVTYSPTFVLPFPEKKFFQIMAGINRPTSQFQEYAKNGTNVVFNFGSNYYFKKHENLSMVFSMQKSWFESKEWEEIVSNNVVKMNSIEKLLSFSAGPRHSFKNNMYVGLSLGVNIFYNKINTDIGWIDTGYGECPDDTEPGVWEQDAFGNWGWSNDDCDPNLIGGLMADLAFTFANSIITVVGDELRGIFNATDVLGGLKFNFGFENKSKTDVFYGLDFTYNIIPALEYPILSKNENKLVDFINADYLSINFSIHKNF